MILWCRFSGDGGGDHVSADACYSFCLLLGGAGALALPTNARAHTLALTHTRTPSRHWETLKKVPGQGLIPAPHTRTRIQLGSHMHVPSPPRPPG